MLVLLDNCLPVKLREHFREHTVETAVYRGWAALENGALIAAAVDAGFDAVVSIDQGHDFARAVAGRPIVAILLPGLQEPAALVFRPTCFHQSYSRQLKTF